MEQNHDPLPPPQRLEMNLPHGFIAGHAVSQTTNTEQYPRTLAPNQAPTTISTPSPTTKPKAPMTRANWVNAFWADLSGQLRRFSVISSDLFDGLLLRRDTDTGYLILMELRSQYDQLGDDRELATVRVLVPERAMGGIWQLLWTIKRPRDPNGRRFHSQTTMDPIDHRNRLELESNPGHTFLGAHFSLPPFIQDYGPGPSEFEPGLGTEFDAMFGGIITSVDNGTWTDQF